MRFTEPGGSLCSQEEASGPYSESCHSSPEDINIIFLRNVVYLQAYTVLDYNQGDRYWQIIAVHTLVT